MTIWRTLSAVFLGALLGLGSPAYSATPGSPSTFCNPLNLDYRIQPGDPCRREAADPACLVYKGDYYLFASKSGGYWWSSDFVNWTLVSPPNLPLEAYAPAVMDYGGALYFMASGAGKLYRSTDPKQAGSWSVVGPVRGDTDPALFADDDGRVWLYYGCSQGGAIWGVELDPTNMFREINSPFRCLHGNEKAHGWEVPGDDNLGGVLGGRLQTVPWVEGAWMTKRKGRYYLQYAAPGTHWKSYGDGVYAASSPTGSFTYADYSPFSFKPTGFMTGAGHSSTFQDRYGVWWHLVTGVVSVNHIFERRLALYPVVFSPKGDMCARTYLGDLPQYLPGRNPHPERGNLAGWMLLSWGKAAEASTSLAEHPASSAFDEDIKTWWSASSGRSNEWLRVDLGSVKTIHAVQVNFAEQEVTARGRGSELGQTYRLDCSRDGNTWTTLVDQCDRTRDRPHDYIELEHPVMARHVRLSNGVTSGGGKFAVRDLRVFGLGTGRPPGVVASVSVLRFRPDPRRVTINWKPSARAEGYIIRYGIRPDALNSQYEVRGTTILTINSLNSETSYYVAVDAFNESGVSPMRSATPVP